MAPGGGVKPPHTRLWRYIRSPYQESTTYGRFWVQNGGKIHKMRGPFVEDWLPSQVGFVLEWIQEIYPELVKIAHVPGNDRQPVRDGRRGDHGVLHQSV